MTDAPTTADPAVKRHPLERLLVWLSPTRRRIDHLMDLRVFCNTLAMLLDAGLPLAEALGHVAAHTYDSVPDFREAAREVAADVTEGKPFASALERRHEHFPTAMRVLAAFGQLADHDAPEDPRVLATLMRSAGEFYADEARHLRQRLILR